MPLCRFAASQDVDLHCYVGGFAIPGLEPLHEVLRDDDVVTIKANANSERNTGAVGNRLESRKSLRYEWCSDREHNGTAV